MLSLFKCITSNTKIISVKNFTLFLICNIVFNSTIFSQNFWKQTNLKNDFYYTIESDNQGNLFAGSSSGIYRTSDGGENWQFLGLSKDSAGYCMIIKNDKIYTGGKSIFYSSDNGNNWINLGSDSIWSSGIAVDSYGSIYIAGSAGVYKLSEIGGAWEKINEVASDCIFIDEHDKIYVGMYKKIYFSTDLGMSWVKVNYQFKTRVILINMNDKGVVYAGSNLGLYKSEDGGVNWIFLTSTWGIWPRDIIFSRDGIYYSSEGQLQFSQDGIYWIVPDITGLPDYGTGGLAIDNNGYMYVSLFNSGVYRSVSPLTKINSDSKNPNNFILSQNYPNPFNPSTTIKYSIPKTSFVSIKVYDILGRQVKTLINEVNTPGNYKIEFSARNLASGLYFYRIQAGDFVQTRKMIFLK